MLNQFSRTELLIGKKGMDILRASHVAVFGIGGVGGFVVEALARSGVGTLELFDNDKICITNINRQIFATHSTVGQYKVDVAEARIKDINPDCRVIKNICFYLPSNSSKFDFNQYSYVVDALDTMTAKIEIVKNAKAAGIPVISAMGAGNKMNSCALEVADIYKTRACPLAKIMRKICRENGIESLKVVYSKETSIEPNKEVLEDDSGAACLAATTKGNRRSVTGSNAFVPAVAGMIIAGEVVRDLTGIKGGEVLG